MLRKAALLSWGGSTSRSSKFFIGCVSYTLQRASRWVAGSRGSPVLIFRYRLFNGDIDRLQHVRACSALVPMCTLLPV